MAVKAFQKELCRLLARNRKDAGDAYVAGGVALNVLLNGARLSRDIDLFHDTDESLARTWDADRNLLQHNGYTIKIVRERPVFIEAVVSDGTQNVIVQWARDSAYRFFPLVEDEQFGLVLHPFDLATNKCLALAGRLEPRDWVDMITCHQRVQPLGYLVWAACGKDVGFSPELILAEAQRSSRFSHEELNALDFEGKPPLFSELMPVWKDAIVDAEKYAACCLKISWEPVCLIGRVAC